MITLFSQLRFTHNTDAIQWRFAVTQLHIGLAKLAADNSFELRSLSRTLLSPQLFEFS